MLNKKLNGFKLNKNKAALVFINFALLITLGCGKRKPPLPPVEKTASRIEISGIQRGKNILLTWNLSNQNTRNEKSFKIIRTDIYRLLEPAASSLILTEEEFSSRSTLIATVPVVVSDVQNGQQNYSDTLEFAGQSARLRYAVRFVNSAGQKTAFSNFLLLEPTTKIAGVPQKLTAQTTKESIFLSWTAPIDNIDGTRPPNVTGYNVYRSDKVNNFELINNTPVTDDQFFDKAFEFGSDYKYFVRTISLGNDGEPIESLDSNSVAITAKDIFPPDAPTAISIAAAPKNLSIFFAFNSEKDIAGYKVYRTTNQNLTKSEWSLLTSELLTTNTFQDQSVEAGKTYFYYLIAVDKFGNKSEPSETVSETAP